MKCKLCKKNRQLESGYCSVCTQTMIDGYIKDNNLVDFVNPQRWDMTGNEYYHKVMPLLDGRKHTLISKRWFGRLSKAKKENLMSPEDYFHMLQTQGNECL